MLKYEREQTDEEIRAIPQDLQHAAYKNRQRVRENNKKCRMEVESPLEKQKRIEGMDRFRAGGSQIFYCEGVFGRGCKSPLRSVLLEKGTYCSICGSEEINRREAIMTSLYKTGLPG
jgi:hypothetical protein